MSASNFLICGPADDRDRANQAALAWDPTGGANTFRAAFLYAVGSDPETATHTACHGPIESGLAPAIQDAVAERFSGWQMIECADPDAALAQAGLARVALNPSR